MNPAGELERADGNRTHISHPGKDSALPRDGSRQRDAATFAGGLLINSDSQHDLSDGPLRSSDEEVLEFWNQIRSTLTG